jgi:hypothetical protein
MQVGSPLMQLVVEQACNHTGQAVVNHPTTKDDVAKMQHADMNALQAAFHLPAGTFGVSGAGGMDVHARRRLVEQYLWDSS